MARRLFTLVLAGALFAFGLIAADLAGKPAQAAGLWYVTPTGNDLNSCLSPAAPCGTINGAIVKASSGDTVYVAEGRYVVGPTCTSSNCVVVYLDKSMRLSGGWNSSFTTQSGYSIIDGQDTHRGLESHFVDIIIDRFVIEDSTGGANQVTSGLYINNGSLTLRNCVVQNNVGAPDISSGAVRAFIAPVSIENCVFKGNIAALGGAIWAYNSDVVITNSVFISNTGHNGGGGVYLSSGSLTTVNTIFAGNTGRFGGAVWAYPGSLRFSNSTIAGNHGGYSGGGIQGEGQIIIRNSIIADNTANNSGPDCVGTVTSEGYNLVSTTTNCTLTPGVGDIVNTDARLIYPAEPLGLVFPRADSPAVNGGNPGGCTTHLGAPITTDQRGVARSGRCDIGAYEFMPSAGPATALYAIRPLTQTVFRLSPFPEPLEVVALDSALNQVPGRPVTFTAPAAEASLLFANGGHTLVTVTDAGGLATTGVVTANAIPGTYTVTAASPVGLAAAFQRTNRQALYLPVNISRHHTCTAFTDDFSNPASGWLTGEDDYVRAEYLNGEYRVLSKQPGYLFLFRAPTCPRQDYVVEVDARWVGEPGNSYGLIFNLYGSFNEYYVLDINTDYRMYRLLRRTASGFETWLSPRQHNAIQPGAAVNHLKVWTNVTDIAFEINGTYITNSHDSWGLGPLGVGLLASSYSDAPSADARFDNFRVYNLWGPAAAEGAADAGIAASNAAPGGSAYYPPGLDELPPWPTPAP